MLRQPSLYKPTTGSMPEMSGTGHGEFRRSLLGAPMGAPSLARVAARLGMVTLIPVGLLACGGTAGAAGTAESVGTAAPVKIGPMRVLSARGADVQDARMAMD